MRISAAILMIGTLFPAAALAEDNRLSVDLLAFELNAPGLSGSAEAIGFDLEYHITDRIELRGFYANGSAAGAPVETATVNLRYLHPVIGPVSAGPRLDYAWSAIGQADTSEALAGVTMRLGEDARTRVDLSASGLTSDLGESFVYEIDGRVYVGNGISLLGGATYGQGGLLGQGGTVLSLGGEYMFAEGLFGSLTVNHAAPSGLEGALDEMRIGIGLNF